MRGNSKWCFLSVLVIVCLILSSCGSDEGTVSIGSSNKAATITFQQATPSADFSARQGNSLVVYNDELWMIGGYDGTNLLNEVWSSADGINWTQFTPDASSDFTPRAPHATVVLNNKIWLIGGTDLDASGDPRYLQDVWSFDGSSWTQDVSAAAYPSRKSPHVFLFDNQIWFIGGKDTNSIVYNDVWSSADGVNWAQVSAIDPFPARDHATPFVFDNKMWILGGFDEGTMTPYYETWYSTDGASWSQGSDLDHDLTGRPTIFNNATYVVGGFNGLSFSSEIWGSVDLKSWDLQTTDGGFSPRDASLIEFSNRLWMIGGEYKDASGDSVYLNDIWYAD